MSAKKGTFPPVLLTCPVFLIGKKRYFSPDPFNQCFTLVKKRYFSPILVVSVLQWGGKGSSPLALHLGHSALPWQCLALHLGHPTLPCVSPQAMGTQREPSHALHCLWGTQHCPCLAAMPCAAPWVPSMSPAIPCVGHGATHLQMACGVIQLFVGSPNSPSCHWHGVTNAHAGGMALVHHHGAGGLRCTQLPLAWGHPTQSGVGSPNSPSCHWHWGHPTPPAALPPIAIANSISI